MLAIVRMQPQKPGLMSQQIMKILTCPKAIINIPVGVDL